MSCKCLIGSTSPWPSSWTPLSGKSPRSTRAPRRTYDIVRGVIDYCLTYPDLYHHPKEDLVFARLQLRDPATAEALGDLRAEHEALGEAIRHLAAAVRQASSFGTSG